MSAEENKALVRRVYDAISKGELTAFDDLLTADFVDHNPDPGQAPGLDGVKQGFVMLRAAFPGLQITVEEALYKKSPLPRNYKVCTKITNGCLSH